VLLTLLQRTGRGLFAAAERALDRCFGPRWNPLYHLGALGFFFFWVVTVSGLYLYAVFDTSIFGAYQSVEWLTHEQWYLGGVMRSLHRYGSDALVVTVITHLSREFFYDRHRGFRWFSWISGVPLLWLMFSSGINGYWLVWDRLAQYIAVDTAEWMDWLPIFGQSMAANFLNQAALSDRFFSLLVFLHIGIPLMLLLGMWIHIQRIGGARVNPPRGLMWGTAALLLGLSLAWPALSQGEANLDRLITDIGLDWFYLAIYPLMDRWSYGGVWWLLLGLTALLFVLPWLPRRRPVPAAVVHLDNCNGCARCHVDCPYNAIDMAPRSDGSPYAEEAVVDPALCAGCGICVGACPTATPFRRATALVAGVELPQLTTADLRARLGELARGLRGQARVLVFGCDHGPDLAAVAGDGVGGLRLPCIAMLPPSFIDYAISRGLADGVLLTGCRAGNCHFRLGIEWTEDRLAGRRDPHLRERVPRERLATLWVGAEGTAELERGLVSFRQRLAALPPYRPGSLPQTQEVLDDTA